MSDLTIAVLLALGSSVSWALANVVVQRSTRLVGTFRSLLWAQVAGGTLAALLALALGQRPPALATLLAGGTPVWLAGAGVASLVAYLSMFYALEHGRLSIAVPIMSGWAVISAAISVLVLHEPVRALQLAGAGVVIAGVVLVSRAASTSPTASTSPMAATASTAATARASRRPRWLLASAGAALGFGLLIPAIGRLTPVFGQLGAVTAVFSADIVLGLPLAALLGVNLRPPPRAALVPVALAGLCETSGFICIALTVGRAPLAVVSPLASLASALTVLYAWVVLKDRPPRVALAGAVMVCAGVIALAL
jgi:drug/metabolite transporter (DMT)-like permease